MLNERKTIVEISEIFKVSYDVVYNLKENKSYKHILTSKREEIKYKYDIKNKFNVDDKQSMYYKILHMFENGNSQSKISKELKCSRNTIRKILTENNKLIPR